MRSNMLTNQKAAQSAIVRLLEEKGYNVFFENDYEKLEVKPFKYAIRRAKYRSIYNSEAVSEFLIVDETKDQHLRIEITIQKSSGSVDQKYPYMYMNAVLSHEDDVLILLDGGGYKREAKKWLEASINNNWLNESRKNLYLFDLIDALKFIEEEL